MYSFTYNGYLLQDDNNTSIYDVQGLDGLDIRTSEDVLTGDDGGNIS